MQSLFDGRRFHNTEPTQDKTLRDILRWRCQRRAASPWPGWVEQPPRAPVAEPPAGQVALQYINHATVLLRLAGLTCVVDPVWSPRVGPGGLIGPRRIHAPGVAWADLPKIDWVLLTHDHYDHCDTPTLRRLAREHGAAILCGLGHAALLRRCGFRQVVELDWFETRAPHPDCTITFLPARHWSNRTGWDRRTRLWGGFGIALAQGPRIHLAGDTSWGRHFAEIRTAWGRPDFACLPIGAYAPRWFMQDHHMDPAEAVQAHQTLEAHRSMALHWGTFPLADDGPDDAPRALEAARRAAGLPDEAFVIPQPGQAWVVGPSRSQPV